MAGDEDYTHDGTNAADVAIPRQVCAECSSKRFRHYLRTQVKYNEFENIVVTEEIIIRTYRNDTNRPIRATDHQQCRYFVEWLPLDSPTMRPQISRWQQ